jgi:4-hydroxy-2-oxoheptanedioate aldolase
MRLRTTLASGRVTAGGWCSIPSAFSAEMMGRTGFDWICVDTQHGLTGYQEMTGMLQALAATGTPSIVRVAWNQPAEIMRALDAGAEGVIVPMVNSPLEAEEAVSACRYPPAGIRSWGPTRAAWMLEGYSPLRANEATVCIAQIETRAAVDALAEIIDVPGLDAIYIGPADLAISYGLTPTVRADQMEHVTVIESILETCRARAMPCGIHCDDPESAMIWMDRGFQLVTVGTDAGYVRRAAQDLNRVRARQTTNL